MELKDLVPQGLLKMLQDQDCSLVHTKEGWVTYPNNGILLLGASSDAINAKLDLIIAKLGGSDDGEEYKPADGDNL